MRRSRPITWDQVRVGLVLMVALGLLALGVFFIGNVGDQFGQRYRLITLMESAAGISVGAPVQVAGQNVGQVVGVDFIAPETRPVTGEAVAVMLGVNVSVRDQIRADSRARVRTQGLLGDRLIDIAPGSADQPILAEGDTLAAAPAISYEELLGQAADAIESLTTLSGDLTETLRRVADGEGSMGRLLVDDGLYTGMVELNDNLNAVLGPIAAGEGGVARLLREDDLYERMLSATASLDTIVGRAARGEGTLGHLLASDSLYRAITSSAERADALLASIEEGDGSIGRLVNDESLYEELLRTIVDLNAFLQDVRTNPRRYMPTIKVF
ncbi:MAG: MlaD family protein [Gemmatimonadota bacterium]|nr:MlaD family protein [Gemmatimonadota bacterium]